MKKISNKYKILGIVIILIILAGSILLCTAGFKKDISYQAGKRIEVFIPNGYEKETVLNLAKESFPDRTILFVEVEKLGQVAGIRLKDYTEDELTDFKKKIAETYEIEEDNLTVEEVDVPAIRISTAIDPYVFPTVLITILSSIYLLFRNLKAENKWIKLLKVIVTLVVVIAIYFSILLIARIPFGDYTMPVALAIYMFTLIKSIAK